MRGQLVAGRYRLDEPLGRGGMAVVWRAQDEVLGRQVAVKVMAEGSLSDARAVERFRQEARVVASLDDANIVTLFDAGLDGRTAFLAMELVDGPSVRDLVDQGPLPVAHAVSIADQVCAALQAAHRAGVVHRDIKPGNLLLTRDGVVKVVDFGIARTTAADRVALTATATVIGTSAFMAPEQAGGGTVDARTDLYALGCVLFMMLVGEPPFAGDDPLAVMYQHLHQPPRSPRRLRPDIPVGLERLILDLLAKDPDCRPADAAAVRERLAEVGLAPTRHTLPHPLVPALAPAVPAAARSGGWAVGRSGERLGGRSAGRRRLVVVSVAALLVAAVGGYMAVAAESHGGSRALAAPSPSASDAPATASATPSASGTALPSAMSSTELPHQSPGAGPTESDYGPSAASWPVTTTQPAVVSRAMTVGGVLALVSQAQAAGEVSPDAAKDLSKRLRDVSQQLQHAHSANAARKIQDTRQRLSDLAKAGKVSPVADTRLAAALDALETNALG